MSEFVLVSGYYGFSNPGDDAILESIISTLKAQNIVPVVLYNTRSHFYKDNVHYIPRYNFLKIYYWMINSSFIILGGGGLFQDSTSFFSFLYYFVIGMISILSGKKLIIYGQSFGPIKRKVSLLLLKIVLYFSEYIFIRDVYSFRLTYLLGEGKKAFLIPDIVYFLDISLTYHLNKKQEILIFPRDRGDIEKLVKILRYIINKFNINLAIIPMHYPIDKDVARSVFEKINDRGVRVIDKPLERKDILREIGDSLGVISYRFHGLVFSHIVGVPFIGISDDPKIFSYLDSLNVKCLSPWGGEFDFIEKWVYHIYTSRKKDIKIKSSLKREKEKKINLENIFYMLKGE